MRRYRLILPALLMSVSLSACSAWNWLGRDEEEKPLPGNRISVLEYGDTLRPDEDALSAYEVPEAWANDIWPQAGGYPNHAMQNLALSKGELKKVWRSSIGTGARKRLPLTAQPVVVGKSVFTLDTSATLNAFSTEDGKRRWSVKVGTEAEKDPVISGGIASEAGMIYVTAGYEEVLCIDAANGQIKWRAKLPNASRAAPTVMSGRVFVTTLSNSVLALDAANGAVLWEYSGLSTSTGLVGAASPAATTDMVVPAFSSGEIFALRAGNGSVAWSDNLASSLQLGGITALSDIRGLPVIDNDIVYAISFGGKMAAIDLRTGARVWQRDIGGAETPWIAGDRLFVITSEAQIVSLDKKDGAVQWVSQLARYQNKERREGPIIWSGPVMAGGRLLAFSTDGRVAEIDASKGNLIREWSAGDGVQIDPIVAGGTLYILDNDGDLTAYR